MEDQNNIFGIFYCFTIERAKMKFKQGENYVYGEVVLTESQWQNWFEKFWSGNFNFEDAEADVDKIKSVVVANRWITTREIAERLNLFNATVHKHIKRLELISKLDIWVPHVLTERNLLRRINVCDTLLRRQRYDPFLKSIVISDEKWVVYM